MTKFYLKKTSVNHSFNLKLNIYILNCHNWYITLIWYISITLIWQFKKLSNSTFPYSNKYICPYIIPVFFFLNSTTYNFIISTIYIKDKYISLFFHDDISPFQSFRSKYQTEKNSYIWPWGRKKNENKKTPLSVWVIWSLTL